MMFLGLPGGSTGGGDCDPGVFGWLFVVLMWLFVLAVAGGLAALLFYVIRSV